MEQIFLGGRSDNLFNFEGKIDEAAVYDHALTAQEATGHYTAANVPVRPQRDLHD